MLQGPPMPYLTLYWRPPISVPPILMWPLVPPLQHPLRLLDWIGAHHMQLHPSFECLGRSILHPSRSASPSLSIGNLEEGTACPRSPRTPESLTYQPDGRGLYAAPFLRVSSTRTVSETSVFDHSPHSSLATLSTHLCKHHTKLQQFLQSLAVGVGTRC
jgi:hypothetical protein